MTPDEMTQLLCQRSQLILSSQFGAPQDAAGVVFADVAKRYAHPSRHYHSLTHVRDVLVEVSGLHAWRPEVPTAEVEIAAFLHDVVYDSRAKDNEERSAEYAH